MAHPSSFHAQATSEKNSVLVTSKGCESTVSSGKSDIRRPPTLLLGSNSSQTAQTVLDSTNPSFGTPGAASEDFHLRLEKNRLDTFDTGWPHNCPVQPKDLAAAGFYYMGTGDVVRCAFCRGTLKEWTRGDNAMTEHQKYFPQCSFVRQQDVGNVPLPTVQSPLHVFPVEWRNQHFPTHQQPQNTEFTDINKRLQSFAGRQLPAGQTAQKLAEAGFYYIGPDDNVKCFCCGGSLKRWQSTDSPWAEHFRWFPHCQLLQANNRNRGVFENTANAFESHIISQPAEDMTASHGGFRLPRIGMVPVPVEEISNESFDPTSTAVSELPSTKGKNPLANNEILGSSLESLQAENQRLKESIMCKICMDANVNVLFLPCGHLVACDKCAPHLHQCPMCRVNIRGSIRTYIA